MKTFPQLIAPTLTSAAVALLTVLFVAPREGAAPAGSAAVPIAPPDPASAVDSTAGGTRDSSREDELLLRLARLEEELGSLAEGLASLERPARQAVEAAGEEPAAALSATLLPTNPQAREFVLETMEAERERQESERRQRFEERSVQLLEGRAQRLAAEVGLTADQEQELATVLLMESERRRSLFDSLRGDGAGMDFETLRMERENLHAWKAEELEYRLGAEAAERVLELDRGGAGPGGFGSLGAPGEGRRGGRAGGFGRGRGGPR